MATAYRSSRFYSRIFAVATVALLGLALFKILQPFFGSIAWALLAAFLLHPTHERLGRWLRGRFSLSAGLLTAATLFICIGPLTALGVTFVRQAGHLLEQIQQRMEGMNLSSISGLQDVPVLNRVLEWLDVTLGISSEQLQSWGMSGTQSVLKYFASAGGSLFIGAVGTVLGFVMMLFLLFFFVRDGAAMFARLVRLIPMAQADKNHLADYLGAVTRAVVFGTLLTALIQGALVGIGFAIISLPSPVVFGAIAAAFALLPLGGTAIVWIPAAIVLAVQGRWGAAIFMTIWGALLVGLIDNFLKPMLISGRAEVPTLAAFLGVIGGLAAFGAIGMFAGPILLALAIALLRYTEERRGEAGPKSA
jgi:predicted PurR-regulated permease PerM